MRHTPIGQHLLDACNLEDENRLYQKLGGGRTRSTERIRRCWTEIGSSAGAEASTSAACGRAATAFGAAVWEVTQTGHRVDSVALEWWWAASAAADQTVSNRQTIANFLEIERTPTPETLGVSLARVGRLQQREA